MYYAELQPRDALMPWLAAHWHFRVEPDAGEIDHWVPPTGGAMVVVPREHEPLIAGPRVTPLETTVRGGDVVWGTHFWPAAATSLLAAETSTLREKTVPARVLLGEDWTRGLADALRQTDAEESAAEVLDAALTALVPRAAPLDERVMTAVFRLIRSGGRASIEAVARSVHLSARQLRRRFRAAAGLSPKELARIQRLRDSAVVSLLGAGESWVDIAASHGYSDQAHLIREFRRLLGLTPRGFDDHVRRIRHGRILR